MTDFDQLLHIAKKWENQYGYFYTKVAAQEQLIVDAAQPFNDAIGSRIDQRQAFKAVVSDLITELPILHDSSQAAHWR